MRKPLLQFLLIASLLPSLAFADDDHAFRPGRGGFRGNERSERPGNVGRGQLNYGGNGCPAGTMNVTFAPDNLSFTILFDKFVADTSSNDNGQVGAMSCDAVLPITIPAGQQMEITRVDYRGFAAIPQGGRGQLTSSYNFVESDGHGNGHGNGHGWRDRGRVNVRYDFAGPQAQNYEISSGDMTNGRGIAQTEISPCGGEAQLRLRNAVRVMAPRGQQAQLTVDSIDGSSNAVYFVNWRACQAQATPPGPPNGMCGRLPCPPRFGDRR